MNPELLLAHFDRICEAPNAIPRLRQFILEVAVRGKLVEQHPNDDAARDLINAIRAEKARLVMDGKIRSQEPQLPVSGTEFDYDLPINWAPTRIGDLLTVIRGASPRPKGDPKYFSKVRTPYHWIKISDIRKHSRDRVLYDTDEFLTEQGMQKSVMLPKGTLVVTNSATIGVPIFLGFEGGCIHDGYLAFPYFPSRYLSKDFFFVLFQTLQAYAVKKARGMAQLNLNTGLVREFPVGLPPLPEQERIVAKVDELMALCDRLEAAQMERRRRKERLAAASLYRLNNHGDDGEYRLSARSFVTQIGRLTTDSEQIDALRQTIINLAVKGKLVPQDPKDEPASEILTQIQAERVRLVKAGEVKEQKQHDANTPRGAPFDVPDTWLWMSLGEIVFGFRYGTSIKCTYERCGEPVLRIPNVDKGRITLQDLKFGPLSQREADDLRLQLGDILMVRSNGSLNLVGRPALVEPTAVGYCYAGYLVRVRTSIKYLDTRYLLLALSTSHTRNQIELPIRTTVGLKNVNATELSGLAIPLAPLAEQRRIVTKVDELMALCDRLEEQLSTARTVSGRLLEAALYSALNNNGGHSDRLEALCG